MTGPVLHRWALSGRASGLWRAFLPRLPHRDHL